MDQAIDGEVQFGMADLSSPAGETEETGGGQAVEIELEPVPESGEAQDGGRL